MKTNKYIQYPLSILILTLFINISVANAQISEQFFIINDTSMSNDCKLNAKVLFPKLIAGFELQKYPNKGVSIRTSICGEGRVPEVGIADLPKAETSFFGGSPNKRKQEMYRFLAKAKKNIDELSEHDCNETQTNLYRTITYLSKFYKKSSQKTLLILSDMAEYSSVFSAERYQNSPSRLLSDYDKILKLFQKDSALPDLADVKVIIVNPMNSDWLLYLSRFWEKFFRTCGAESVEVRTVF